MEKRQEVPYECVGEQWRKVRRKVIDIQQGLQELGQVSAGLVNFVVALEYWGEYHRQKKLKGAACYLNQLIVN